MAPMTTYLDWDNLRDTPLETELLWCDDMSRTFGKQSPFSVLFQWICGF
jgi:hypothetical protein